MTSRRRVLSAESFRHRLGLYGDLPWRLMEAGIRAVPDFFERPLTAAWTTLIFILASEPRRAVAANLRALFPDKSGTARTVLAWRTFHRFAASMVDWIRVCRGQQVISWSVSGLEHFRRAAAGGQPVLLFTAHMGLYDGAAAVFARHTGRRFAAVRLPERNPHLQSLREATMRQTEDPCYRTVFNHSENLLGVELLRALRDGEWVALQADRAMPGLSVVEATRHGLTWRLPSGPFVLARAARAMCLPVFVTADGFRRYRITFHPPQQPPDTGERLTAVAALREAWLDALHDTINRAPDQWLVFEPAFSAGRADPAPASRESAPPPSPDEVLPAPVPPAPAWQRHSLGVIAAGASLDACLFLTSGVSPWYWRIPAVALLLFVLPQAVMLLCAAPFSPRKAPPWPFTFAVAAWVGWRVWKACP